MKWKFKKIIGGETRFRKKFLIFPKILNNELRWLETAEWEERFVFPGKWLGIRWIKRRNENEKH
jgi:hypothetical protein